MKLLVAFGITSLALPASHLLAQDWASFNEDTGNRIVASSSLVSNDTEEKDYAWGDLDGDGDTDLVIVRKQPFTTTGGRRNVLLMNEGGILVDRTVEYATASNDGGNGFLDETNDRDVVVGDVNGDGLLDVITLPALNQSLAKSMSHPRIYINLGSSRGMWQGLFYDEPRIPTMPTAPNGCGLAIGDVTGDGANDIYLTDYNSDVEDKLLINDGNGFFTDQTTTRMNASWASSGFGTAAEIIDVNGDGVNDIVKSENGPSKVTYNNPANEGFFLSQEEISNAAVYFMNTGDLNNDGMIDIILGTDGADLYLLNQGNGADGQANFVTSTFSFQSGGDDGFPGNVVLGDLNNDGMEDVLIADVDVDISGCGRRLNFYRNLGNVPNVTLQDQGTLGLGTSNLTGTHDVAVFDLDNDGWLDMVIGRCSGTQVWINQPPIGMAFSYPTGIPAVLEPGEETRIQVRLVVLGDGEVDPDSVTLKASTSGSKLSIPMEQIDTDLFEASLPAVECPERVEFHVAAGTLSGTNFTDPTNAPTIQYSCIAVLGNEVLFRDELEEDAAENGWTVQNDPKLTAGQWEQADPNVTITGGQVASPEDDATANDGVMAFITQQGLPGGSATAADVDGGPTTLYSPIIDFEGTDGTITYARWFFCSDQVNPIEADVLVVQVTSNGTDWVLVEEVDSTSSQWLNSTFTVSDYVTPTSTVQVRFICSDIGNNSVTEAGVDNFEVQQYICSATCPGDYNGDGEVSGEDLGALLGAWGTDNCDINISGSNGCIINGEDLGALLGSWGVCR
ncbi:MAG: hypothetical protein CMJ32_08530 [Phycisphaerae bacterium]|nr:hypothetical protein [Phycisphaerae bacterium]